MPDTFEIVVPTEPVTLGKDRSGLVKVDVTSQLDRSTTANVQVLPGDGSEPTWFGEPEPGSYTSETGETQVVRVPIAVPADAPAGTGTFRVRAYAEDRPSEDYTESAPIEINIPDAEPGRPVPRWLIAAIAAVVVALVAGTAFLLLRDGDGGTVDVPALVGSTSEDATVAAGDVPVQLLSGNDGDAGTAEQCVLFQFPAAGSEDEPTTMPEDSGVVALTVPCPTETALTPETVQITTDIALFDGTDASYDNLCDVADGPSFCAAVATAVDASDREVSGEAFLEAAFDEILHTQEELFRTVHSNPVVPDLTGLQEREAAAKLDLVGLTLEITEVLTPETSAPTFTIWPPLTVIPQRRCDRVLTQDPDPGTAPEDVPDGTVRTTMRRELCRSVFDFNAELDVEIPVVEGL